MSEIVLDKERMKKRGATSSVWGVPIKPRVDSATKQRLESIIKKILSNARLTNSESNLLKERVLGDWKIRKSSAETIEYLVAIYYDGGIQKVIGIYKLSPQKIKVAQGRVRWTKGEWIECIPDLKKCCVGDSILNLHRTFNSPQRMFFN